MRRPIRRAVAARGRQLGQATVEYVIVATVGILVLTTGPGEDAVQAAMEALQDNYRGYSYAVSLSDYPDARDEDELRDLLLEQGVPVDEIEHFADDPEAFMTDLVPYDLSSPPDVGDFASGLVPSSAEDVLDLVF